MKIEVAESLCASWLRHVKGCQVVETNWSNSPSWEERNKEKISNLYTTVDNFFKEHHGYNVFKDVGEETLLKEAECDVLGVKFQDGKTFAYGIDTAFHSAGLGYGDKHESTRRVIKKCTRTAMSILQYTGICDGEIVFVSPKINPSVMDVLEPCIIELDKLLQEVGLDFKIRILANNDFSSEILQPVMEKSTYINDDNELFLRSYQLMRLGLSFDNSKNKNPIKKDVAPVHDTNSNGEKKVGELARVDFRILLESGNIDNLEIENLQDAIYSKKVFDMNYPILVKADADYDNARYYAGALRINDISFKLCNDWYKKNRQPLIDWINKYGKVST